MYDGTIKIGTKVDAAGFDAGISKLMGSLKKLAALVAVAFSARAILNFTKAAVKASSDLSSALIGLKSIVDGTGNSFKRANKFVQEYVADGLVPAMNAITAYKNLLARGYTADQAEQVLIALKNSATFGRQASLSLGEAVQSATEGLKNENSILVDNAGVTKNVSVMWEEYAKSIGTTVKNLTKEQKIQAEVNGIMEETKFQTGDAAKASKTYAGQMAALNVSLTNFKVAVGNVVIPFLQKILPYIRSLIDNLTAYASRIATIVGVFFGTSLEQATDNISAATDGTEALSEAQADLATNAKKAGNALAAFDELDVLNLPESEASAAIAAPAVPLPVLDKAEADKSLDDLKAKIEDFKRRLQDMFAPARDAFQRLTEAIEPLWIKLQEGMGWVWQNILKPFTEWAIQSFLPVFIDMLAGAFRALDAALIVLTPVFSWLWENIFKPFAQVTGWLILQSIEGWTLAFNDLADWLYAHPDLFANFGHAAADEWTFIQDLWRGAGKWFYENVVTPIVNYFATMWANLRQQATDALTTMFGKWVEVLNGIKSYMKGVVNSIIDMINGMIGALASGVNAIASMLNAIQINVPSWVPGFGGQTWSMNLPTVTAPQIPRLAEGAVIPPNAQFLAVLGDQKSGRNLEAPEGLIRQIIREEMGGGEMTVNMPVYLDGEKIYQSQKRVSTRHGTSLITSGVTA